MNALQRGTQIHEVLAIANEIDAELAENDGEMIRAAEAMSYSQRLKTIALASPAPTDGVLRELDATISACEKLNSFDAIWPVREATLRRWREALAATPAAGGGQSRVQDSDSLTAAIKEGSDNAPSERV